MLLITPKLMALVSRGAVAPQGLPKEGRTKREQRVYKPGQALRLLGAGFSTGRLFKRGAASHPRQMESSPYGFDFFSYWLFSDSDSLLPFVLLPFLALLLPEFQSVCSLFLYLLHDLKRFFFHSGHTNGNYLWALVMWHTLFCRVGIK